MFKVGNGGMIREDVDITGRLERVDDCTKLDREESTVVEFSVGKGGTAVLEEDATLEVPGGVEALVEFHDGLEEDTRLLEGNPGGSAVTVIFKDTETLLGFGEGIVGNEDGSGTGVGDPVTFHGPVSVGSEMVIRLSEDGTGGRIVGGVGTTTEESRDILTDGRGGSVVDGSDGNESPPLMVENPIDRETFTVGSVIIGSDVEGFTPVVKGIDDWTEDSEVTPPVETGVDTGTEELVVFKVGKGGSESDGSRTVDDTRGGVNDLDKLMLLPIGKLLGAVTTLVPVPTGIESADDSTEVVEGMTVGSEGRTDKPIEFDADSVDIPVPGSKEDRTTEDGPGTGGLNDTETPTDSDGRGIPDGSTHVPFWAHTMPTRPATTSEELSIMAIDDYSSQEPP